VVHLKPEAGGADFRSLRTELLRLLSSVGQTGQTGQSGRQREPAG
jgi:hypothetical protein